MGDKNLQVRATFMLDEKGRPVFRADSNGVKHYSIELSVENAPATVRSVTYRLDDTYHNPIREVFDATGGFKESLTSYGDYTIVASPSGDPSFAGKSRVRLYDALREGMKATTGDNKGITGALRDIQEG